MRVLIESMSYHPNTSGVAITVENLAIHLQKNGHEVFLVVPARGLRSSVEKVNPRLTVYRLRGFPSPMRRGYFIPLMVKRLVKKIINETKPNIIHVNDPLAMSRYLQAEATRRRIPTIVSNHFSFEYIMVYLPRFLESWARLYFRAWIVTFYNRCQAVVAPSLTVADELRRAGVRVPIEALSNGVDLHRFYADYSWPATRHALGLDNRPVVLYVGRIDKDKSVPVLLIAAHLILPRVRCQFVMVGDGDCLTVFHRQIVKEGLSKDILFLKRLPNKSPLLTALYQLSAVFVMPSAIETQSISTLEAMAAGLPVIGANSGALPELIKDGYNGYLFSPGDAQDLAKKINLLLDNRKCRKELGENSLRIVAEHELGRCLDLFVKLYRGCLAEN